LFSTRPKKRQLLKIKSINAVFRHILPEFGAAQTQPDRAALFVFATEKLKFECYGAPFREH